MAVEQSRYNPTPAPGSARMQTWTISYTTDKKKAKNRCWQQGKMNYNVSTFQAHFYDEDNVEIGKMKMQPGQVVNDAEISLWQHLIELGVMEKEEECVEDLFAKLNRELGIEEFKSSGVGQCDGIAVNKSVYKGKLKVPTLISGSEPVTIYDILYIPTQKRQKSCKEWLDGSLKYYPTLKLGEFYNEGGGLMHKKTMEEVKEGGVIEDAAGGTLTIEIGSKRADAAAKDNLVSGGLLKRSFSILYTTDKHKKSKKWLDGLMEYDATSQLAKFLDETSGECFHKKVMREMVVAAGEEFETGMYIVQVDHEISSDAGGGKRCMPCSNEIPTAKKFKAQNKPLPNHVPSAGRSSEELLSLLKQNKN